ncbi:uncharacterized protein K460DRAFT_342150 [Cucurbitaria berberidis CBS 394.84]|uniref:RING-type domain-containing protein n=1 Tax=Cucurbitaria berberidis CBS 394.84 TaxID=1168544 RepID=A0A9P4GDR2_9PLEO|nr:uncharacterized protein K460DRAFT_342150 [Cucurbitaria berberidis CBS 394.84]KAF1843705.1 hypothetical protein K460DRAFT_342150 [Cucurbitaria berberidis CBS 394.84]
MAVVKTRGAVKKLGPIVLGRKIVQFKIKNCSRHFTLHEDLICANSKYFKERLQKDCKAIKEGCAICHEQLDPKVDDITFCRAKCGQNVHENCIEECKTSETGRDTCPMCRKNWKNKTEDPIIVENDLDRDAVQIYIDWLYTGTLHIDENINRGKDDFNLVLLKAWKVATILKDWNFMYAIIAEYIGTMEDGSNAGFWVSSTKYAFEDENIKSMQIFVIDAFLVYMRDDWFETWASKFPPTFTHAVCGTVLGAIVEKESSKDLLARHTHEQYELEEHSNAGETNDEDEAVSQNEAEEIVSEEDEEMSEGEMEESTH